MGLTYFKRFRMEIDLAGRDYSALRLPKGYHFVPWSPAMLEEHAEAKYGSFRTEIDANVFPCFNSYEGCLRLMDEIIHKDGFLPAATWLLVYDDGRSPREACGTIQGLLDSSGHGAIQNIGITPHHRGRGIGRRLIHRALEGFQSVGLSRVCLEVTAQNRDAVRLYQRMGFRKVRTVYKAVEVVYA